MYHLSLIGIGAGNPDHLTLQAIEAINACDVILIPLKGADKDDLAQARREICARVLRPDGPVLREFALPRRDPSVPDYRLRVARWHDEIARIWEAEIRAALPQGGRVGFLVWGDPSLYDSSLRIADRLAKTLPHEREVIAGITAIQAMTASHRIPLNLLAEPVTITTGRKLREEGWPEGAQTLVVMLDSGGAFLEIDPNGVEIWWAAYAGMKEEILCSGALSDTAAEITKIRDEARKRHGWIMDIYLLRKTRQR